MDAAVKAAVRGRAFAAGGLLFVCSSCFCWDVWAVLSGASELLLPPIIANPSSNRSRSGQLNGSSGGLWSGIDERRFRVRAAALAFCFAFTFLSLDAAVKAAVRGRAFAAGGSLFVCSSCSCRVAAAVAASSNGTSGCSPFACSSCFCWRFSALWLRRSGAACALRSGPSALLLRPILVNPSSNRSRSGSMSGSSGGFSCCLLWGFSVFLFGWAAGVRVRAAALAFCFAFTFLSLDAAKAAARGRAFAAGGSLFVCSGCFCWDVSAVRSGTSALLLPPIIANPSSNRSHSGSLSGSSAGFSRCWLWGFSVFLFGLAAGVRVRAAALAFCFAFTFLSLDAAVKAAARGRAFAAGGSPFVRSSCFCWDVSAAAVMATAAGRAAAVGAMSSNGSFDGSFCGRRSLNVLISRSRFAVRSCKFLGNTQEMSGKVSGNFKDVARKWGGSPLHAPAHPIISADRAREHDLRFSACGNFLQQIWKITRKNPWHFRDISGTIPRNVQVNFPDMFGKCPVSVRENSRPVQGFWKQLFLKCEDVSKMFRILKYCFFLNNLGCAMNLTAQSASPGPEVSVHSLWSWKSIDCSRKIRNTYFVSNMLSLKIGVSRGFVRSLEGLESSEGLAESVCL